MEFDKKPDYPIVKVDGFVSVGNQYDIDITLPEDGRGVVYGIIRDCNEDPICDAVVKLVEIERIYGKEDRKPVTHTFTDKYGEFVFGPLCKDKCYAIEIWAEKVKHHKICKVCDHKGKCLKGEKIVCPPKHDCFPKQDCLKREDCNDTKDFESDKSCDN